MCPGTAIGTDTPGDIRPVQTKNLGITACSRVVFFIVIVKNSELKPCAVDVFKIGGGGVVER